MQSKEPRGAKTILKNKMERFVEPNIQFYFKAKVIKTLVIQ